MAAAVVILVAILPIASSQPTIHREFQNEFRGDCTREGLLAALGSFTEYTNEGIVAWEQLTDGVTLENIGRVKIVQATILCEAPGVRRNTISSASVLVDWECIGPGASCTIHRGLVLPFTDQFTLDCVVREHGDTSSASWYPPRAHGDVVSRLSRHGLIHPGVPAPGPCGMCVDPDSVASSFPGVVIDSDTFCAST